MEWDSKVENVFDYRPQSVLTCGDAWRGRGSCFVDAKFRVEDFYISNGLMAL